MKKGLSFIFALIVFATSIIPMFAINAAAADLSDAKSITLGTQYTGEITDSNNQNLYKFTISTSGRVNVNVTAYIPGIHMYIYDSNGTTVWTKDYQSWNNTSKQYSCNINVDFTSGTYYFCIKKYSGTGNYNFKLSFTSANESFAETQGGVNDSLTKASSISFGNSYTGQLATNEQSDFYKFTMSSSGRINVYVIAYIPGIHMYIYDSNGTTVWTKDYQSWNNTSMQYSCNTNIDFTSGTYYLCIKKYSGTGNYNFKLSYTSANESFKETLGGTNDSLVSASSISLGTSYNGQLASNEQSDFYKFTVSSSNKITLNIVAYIPGIHMYIYDSNGTTVWTRDYQSWNNTSMQYLRNESIELKSGTYYFCIKKYSGTGNYTFSISSGTPTPPASTKPTTTTTTRPAPTDPIPVTTTRKPVTTTRKPVTTTKKPVTTTRKPVTTTRKPVTTTRTPVTTTRKPVTTTRKPVTTTRKPVTTARPEVPTTVVTPPETDYTINYPSEEYTTSFYEYNEPVNNVYNYNYFEYTIINNEIIINNYYGTDDYVVIPEEIDGYPVTGIKDGTFDGTNVTQVEIPESVYQFDAGCLESDMGQITIIAEEDSPAEQFASENGFDFVYTKEENPLKGKLPIIIGVIAGLGILVAVVVVVIVVVTKKKV